MAHVSVSVPKAPFVVLRGPFRNLLNRWQGDAGPRAKERIWIDPSRLTRIYTRNPSQTPDFKRRHSGMVIGGDWDQQTEPLDRSWKIAACLDHFCNGTAWRDTGIYDNMRRMIAQSGRFDSCETEADIIARYRDIDALYADIRRNGFADQTVHRFGAPRLPEGVFIHIDRAGQPIFGAIGNHRLAIARALGLVAIPAQLGVIHRDAVRSDALAGYRARPEDAKPKRL